MGRKKTNAKVIELDGLTVFVVKEKAEHGLSPFDVTILFVAEGELNRIGFHFKTEQAQHEQFMMIDKLFVEKELKEWKEFYS